MWHWDGMHVPTYDNPDDIPGVEDPAMQPLSAVGHEIEYIPGTRRAQRAVIWQVDREGKRSDFDLEALLCFRMKGIGYGHPTWGHGKWHGDLAIGGESWKCDEIDEMGFENQHIQQVVRARNGSEEGIGVLEQICYGPHSKYGFKDILDPAS